MSDSETYQTHLPCPCGQSSDAFAVYTDGHGRCFGKCGGRHFKREALKGYDLPPKQAAPASSGLSRFRTTPKPKRGPALIEFDRYEGIPDRGIKQETCEKFGYFIADHDGKPRHVAPYRDRDGRIVGQKVRDVGKHFHTRGDFGDVQLFGQHLHRHGGKHLLIVEGELDALAAHQMISPWNVVSLPNGAQGAVAAIERNLEFVESYDRVVICFDMDEPGREAAQKVAAMLTPGRAHIMELPEKDACDMLVAKRQKDFAQAFWDARPFMPGGIVNGADLWDAINAPVTPGIPYPWPDLNRKTFGQRKGELVTWTSGSGMGKSAFIAEIAFDLLKQGYRVGYVALEENVSRTALRIVGLQLSVPIHLPDHDVPLEVKQQAFVETLGTGRFYTFDHFGSIEDGDILSKLRFLAKACGCDFVFVDHISIIVSGMDDIDDERRTIDVLMTKLRSLVEETGAGMHLVSHLRRKSGRQKSHEEGGTISLADLRGSHSIAQLSDMVIGLERNQQAKSEEARDTTKLRVLKNRYSGDTGLAAAVRYDHATGRLHAVSLTEIDDDEDDDEV